MEDLTKDLLKQFVYMDEKIVLYAPDGSFEIPLSITAAKLYSPVIKAALESPLGKGDGKSDSKELSVYRLQRLKVQGFDHETVQIFVRCLQGQADDAEIKTFSWDKVRKLIEICHFYGVDDIFHMCLEKGKQLLQHNNVVEAIRFMEKYGFQQTWCDQIVNIITNQPAPFNTADWRTSITECPHTQSQIQYHYIKRKLGYG